jgi:hypothetical protein
MRLASLPQPFDHPDWIYELKLDDFSSLAHVGPSGCRLLSRNRNEYKSFAERATCLAAELHDGARFWTGRLFILTPLAELSSTTAVLIRRKQTL